MALDIGGWRGVDVYGGLGRVTERSFVSECVGGGRSIHDSEAIGCSTTSSC